MFGQRVQGPVRPRALREQQQQRREAEGREAELHQRRQQVQGELKVQLLLQVSGIRLNLPSTPGFLHYSKNLFKTSPDHRQVRGEQILLPAHHL